MLLYDTALAPNPKRVRIFLAEKGISIPTRSVDLLALEHKDADFRRINPMGAVPALVLDDGDVLTETVAICRYIEWLHPEPPLLGRDGREQAFVDMWQRRMEFSLFLPVAMIFRHTHPRLAAIQQPQLPDYAESLRPRAIETMRFLDGELSRRPYVAGDAFTIADITAFVAMELTTRAGLAVPDDLPHLARWRQDVSARPSAAA